MAISRTSVVRLISASATNATFCCVSSTLAGTIKDLRRRRIPLRLSNITCLPLCRRCVSSRAVKHPITVVADARTRA
uniref:Putative secreted protein n=1 Tax=Anopheles darlingi TaxID=43151 RepID=A0A2M4DJI1_ANODA